MTVSNHSTGHLKFLVGLCHENFRFWWRHKIGKKSMSKKKNYTNRQPL